MVQLVFVLVLYILQIFVAVVTMFVGDIATRYDPPRTGRVNPNGWLQEKPSNIQGNSLLRLIEGLSPEAA